jgi:NADH dehydrogenase FAD-containing subunit
LLYQVATATLAPAEIATPIRQLVSRQKNTTVGFGEVCGVDTAKRQVLVNYLNRRAIPLDFDYLILATGASHNYFGHEEFANFAPGLKELNNATTIRDRILRAFEFAEIEDDPKEHQDLLTFVLVGAGPTGVELSGAIAEVRRFTLASDFRRVNPKDARIILVQSGPRILPTFHQSLARAAHRRLEALGVEIRTGARVSEVDAKGVSIGGERIWSRTVIWTAGVTPSPAGQWLGSARDKSGARDRRFALRSARITRCVCHWRHRFVRRRRQVASWSGAGRDAIRKACGVSDRRPSFGQPCAAAFSLCR